MENVFTFAACYLYSTCGTVNVTCDKSVSIDRYAALEFVIDVCISESFKALFKACLISELSIESCREIVSAETASCSCTAAHRYTSVGVCVHSATTAAPTL